jgi:hypothetical protein
MKLVFFQLMSNAQVEQVGALLVTVVKILYLKPQFQHKEVKVHSCQLINKKQEIGVIFQILNHWSTSSTQLSKLAAIGSLLYELKFNKCPQFKLLILNIN